MSAALLISGYVVVGFVCCVVMRHPRVADHFILSGDDGFLIFTLMLWPFVMLMLWAIWAAQALGRLADAIWEKWS